MISCAYIYIYIPFHSSWVATDVASHPCSIQEALNSSIPKLREKHTKRKQQATCTGVQFLKGDGHCIGPGAEELAAMGQKDKKTGIRHDAVSCQRHVIGDYAPDTPRLIVLLLPQRVTVHESTDYYGKLWTCTVCGSSMSRAGQIHVGKHCNACSEHTYVNQI